MKLQTNLSKYINTTAALRLQLYYLFVSKCVYAVVTRFILVCSVWCGGMVRLLCEWETVTHSSRPKCIFVTSSSPFSLSPLHSTTHSPWREEQWGKISSALSLSLVINILLEWREWYPETNRYMVFQKIQKSFFLSTQTKQQCFGLLYVLTFFG